MEIVLGMMRDRISIHTTTQVVTKERGRNDKIKGISIHTTTQVVTLSHADVNRHLDISIHTTTQVVTKII